MASLFFYFITMGKEVLSKNEREKLKGVIEELSHQYNNMEYFTQDPVIFPRKLQQLHLTGEAEPQDVEIGALFAAHLAWGRREMIVKSCEKLMEEFSWRPYSYLLNGEYRREERSLHRTIKWSHIASILDNLKEFYTHHTSLESLSPEEIRVNIFGSKSDPRAANKKIHLMRRWMVRRDNIVDLGLWRESSPQHLIIPLDVHVFRNATQLGITKRKGVNFATAIEITQFLKEIFPKDPCLGDFALFGFSASNKSGIFEIRNG